MGGREADCNARNGLGKTALQFPIDIVASRHREQGNDLTGIIDVINQAELRRGDLDLVAIRQLVQGVLRRRSALSGARLAEGLMKNARGHLALHRSLAAQGLGPAVAAVRRSATSSMRPSSVHNPFAWCSRPKSWLAGADCRTRTNRASWPVAPYALPTGLLGARAGGEFGKR